MKTLYNIGIAPLPVGPYLYNLRQAVAHLAFCQSTLNQAASALLTLPDSVLNLRLPQGPVGRVVSHGVVLHEPRTPAFSRVGTFAVRQPCPRATRRR